MPMPAIPHVMLLKHEKFSVIQHGLTPLDRLQEETSLLNITYVRQFLV
jgi:hypothetical protein